MDSEILGGEEKKIALLENVQVGLSFRRKVVRFAKTAEIHLGLCDFPDESLIAGLIVLMIIFPFMNSSSPSQR